ncbi:large ribosomal subunit protein mL43-like [Dysidea avara]|uniref:large ribosomal subunit protein mL43-like n=1 Tax=Dysidea avara TaxID=196820 RepID=UPI00331A6343
MAQLTAFNNGVAQYMCQIKRITLNYCRAGGSSQGMRKFINDHVVEFAKSNPSVAVYVRERPGFHPRLVAEFLNGRSQIVSTKNFSVEDTQKHLNLLRTSTGRKPEKLKKPWKTDSPSIQGNWHPFMFKT